MLSVVAKLAVTATLHHLHLHHLRLHLLLLLVTTMNTATIAQLLTMTTVATNMTATNVLGLGQRMTLTNGTLQLPLVGVCQRTQIRTLSLTLLTMSLEMIARPCKTRIAASLTVFNAHGLGPNPTLQDGMVMMPDVDASIREVMRSPTKEILL